SRHAADVDGELPVELGDVVRWSVHRAGHKDAGVVYEDVEAAEALHDRVDQPLHLSGIALVGLEGRRANALAFEFTDERLRLVGGRRVTDGDVGALFGERACGGGADAA